MYIFLGLLTVLFICVLMISLCCILLELSSRMCKRCIKPFFQTFFSTIISIVSVGIIFVIVLGAGSFFVSLPEYDYQDFEVGMILGITILMVLIIALFIVFFKRTNKDKRILEDKWKTKNREEK